MDEYLSKENLDRLNSGNGKMYGQGIYDSNIK